MNWKLEFTGDKNYVKVTLTGDFNASDHLQMVEDIVSQQYWQSGMNLLIDSRVVVYSTATLDVMREASSNMSRFESQIGSGKAAVLMKAVFDFGKGRQFEMLAEGKSEARIKIFLDESEAVRWLVGKLTSN